jgi:hypothetical protein
MVNVGVYTPWTARRKIEEIDRRVEIPTFEIMPDPGVSDQSHSGSHGQRQTQSPSLDRYSQPWDIEDSDKLPDDDDDDI